MAQKRLRAFLSHFFTVGVVKKNGIYKEPSQSSLRDASSPEGGAFCYLPVSNNKAPPSGELANECEPERARPFSEKKSLYCKNREGQTLRRNKGKKMM